MVDDEGSIVDAVATALRYEGYDVREAANGRDTLAAVAEFDPDLLVLVPVCGLVGLIVVGAIRG